MGTFASCLVLLQLCVPTLQMAADTDTVAPQVLNSTAISKPSRLMEKEYGQFAQSLGPNMDSEKECTDFAENVCRAAGLTASCQKCKINFGKWCYECKVGDAAASKKAGAQTKQATKGAASGVKTGSAFVAVPEVAGAQGLLATNSTGGVPDDTSSADTSHSAPHRWTTTSQLTARGLSRDPDHGTLSNTGSVGTQAHDPECGQAPCPCTIKGEKGERMVNGPLGPTVLRNGGSTSEVAKKKQSGTSGNANALAGGGFLVPDGGAV